ncbi:MAG: PIN domain-containing protein [Spirosomataceae bacterium]
MSGNRFLLDTNAITALLQGNRIIVNQLKEAEWVGVAIVSQLEFLANPALNEEDRMLFNSFLQRVHVLDLTQENIELTTAILQIRLKYKVKLPDAIIAGSTLYASAKLISSDGGFDNIKKLKVIKF